MSQLVQIKPTLQMLVASNNVTAGSLSEALVLQFAIIKGAVA